MANFTTTGSDTYPAGHMRFLANTAMTSVNNANSDTHILTALATGTFTAGSKIYFDFRIGSVYTDVDNGGYMEVHAVGTAASTGTPSHSGLGAGSSGTKIIQELGYFQSIGTNPGYSVNLVVTPTNSATSASYNVYIDEIIDGHKAWFYKMTLSLWEIYQ